MLDVSHRFGNHSNSLESDFWVEWHIVAIWGPVKVTGTSPDLVLRHLLQTKWQGQLRDRRPYARGNSCVAPQSVRVWAAIPAPVGSRACVITILLNQSPVDERVRSSWPPS